MLGAEVYPVPAVAYDNPKNYNHLARDYAKNTPNAIWTDQFDNRANMDAHYRSTGPEIWRQTHRALDGFVCSTGTGGSLAGIGNYLLEQNNKTQIWLADPPGSVLYSYITSGGKLKERSGSSITEGFVIFFVSIASCDDPESLGIGQGRITENFGAIVNRLSGALHISDAKTIAMVYELLDSEGLYMGASSALNVVAAVELAQKLGPGKTVVTLLCDGAYRYQSRLFSKNWIRAKGLEDAIPEHLKKYAVLD